MNQDKIWDYFQNQEHSDQYFSEARQRYMLRSLRKGSTVLNIGVGSGAIERLGCEKGVEMYSLDPSKRTIDRLRQDLRMGFRAQVGYAQAIPFDDDKFDAVVMSEVLEHLDDDILSASLDEARRVLKPSGFMLASTPYRERLVSNRVVCPSCGNVFHKMGHVQAFDKLRMQQLLEMHGLRMNRACITTFVDWRRKGIRNFVKSILRVFLARLGEGIADPHLVVIAKKIHGG